MGLFEMLTDVGLWFMVGLIFAPPGVEYITKGDAAFPDIQAYFLDPVFLGGGVALTVLLWLLFGGGKDLSTRDLRVARWYLLNGTIIHICMDGLVGSFHKWPLFYKQYCTLDKRFITGHPIPWTVGVIEFFGHSLFCFLTYYGYHNRRRWTPAAELFACAFQIFGAIAFVLAEFREGLENVPADWNLDFSWFHLFYFWFGFGANFVWLLIPGTLAWTATQRIAACYDPAGKPEHPTLKSSKKKH
eukprot:TRINITY_DN2721_c0_g1_i1.p1 TRINITY_DN2721_c0_g1~~TRINITY_DN2721_c0_g1_i1.p1  ORF type:complete len:244 (+),score=51.69 TRINITY_DN2721_c0_g1_i1:25-756(+)